MMDENESGIQITETELTRRSELIRRMHTRRISANAVESYSSASRFRCIL